jgi:uncharacterized repeat protein (TIGR01451 family)
MKFSLKRHLFSLTILVRLLAITTLLVSLLFGSGTISQVFAACTVSGTVYRDYNANGVQDPQEPGEPGIVVTAFDATGQVSTTTSGATGTYSLAVGSNDPEVRIEFSGLPIYLRSGPFGGESDTTVTFVACAGAVTGVDLGTANPGQYCHTTNPTVGTPCFAPGALTNPVVANSPALVTFPYNAGGPPASFDNPPHATEAITGDVGSVFGLAYQRTTDTYFLSAFLKRHVSFGPNGPGAIYALDRATGTVTTLTTIAGTGSIPGRPVEFNPGEGYVRDESSFAEVGKMSLGELDISQDDTTLYTINLNNNRLVRIIIASGTTANFAIPNPSCTNGVFRPFGLGIYDFQVYVGGVCDASGAAGTAADLEGVVFVFNPTTNTFTSTPVLRFPLDYPRRCIDFAPGCSGGAADAEWQPWSDVWPAAIGGGPGVANPQPILADIEFNDGNMILGFRDRFGDQSGHFAHSTVLGDNTLYLGLPAGDILRACGDPTNGWTLESGANCGGVQTAGNTAPFDLQGPGNGEYYFTDDNEPTAAGRHDEITLGGIYQLPGSPDTASVVFDPVPDDNELFDAGVVWLSNALGTRSRSYRIYNGGFVPSNIFGKANGLGSLEATCGPAPLEIGNRIWEDLDRNGLQDPGEVVLDGVVVNLYDGAGVFIASTTTDPNGEYYFNEATVFDPADPRTWDDIDGDGTRDLNEPAGIMPFTDYQIRLDDPANYGVGGPLELYFITPNNTVLDMRDSDGTNPRPAVVVDTTNFSRVTLTTGDFGENDHTFDFGFALQPPPPRTPTPPPPDGGDDCGPTVSKSVNPAFAQPGATVTWTIVISNPCSTPLTNVTASDTLPDELEIISASASAGTVNVSGQDVSFSQGTMPPNSSTTITIVTRVRPGTPVPFTITNVAFVGGQSASATLVSAEALPPTGTSPAAVLRLPLLAFGAGIALMGAWWVARRVRM